MVFTLKHDEFEGPLDLLLDLIEKHKLHINDIALAKVTDEYIEYVKKIEEFPLAESAQFILIASTLLLIKSKSLLPSLSLTTEEEGSIVDLERRLQILKRMRELSVHVKNLFGTNVIFAPEARPRQPIFSPDQSMTLTNLREAVSNVLLHLPKKEFLPKAIVQKVISLEETIEHLTKRITSSLKMSFRDFAKIGSHQKVNVIVSFLAMLELVKQGIINVTQDKHFEDIHMETENIGVPNYN